MPIVDNFFQKRQKRAFLRVKMNKNSLKNTPKRAINRRQYRKKSRKNGKSAASGLAQLGVKLVTVSVSVFHPNCAKPPCPVFTVFGYGSATLPPMSRPMSDFRLPFRYCSAADELPPPPDERQQL